MRHQALGHMQQGGSPSPYDRLLATRLVARALRAAGRQFERGDTAPTTSAKVNSAVEARPVRTCSTTSTSNRRPFHRWWLDLVPFSAVSLQNPEREAAPIPIDDPVADLGLPTPYEAEVP